MPDFSVSTKFSHKDKLTGFFKKAGKGADKFGSRADRAFKKASKSATSFGTITKSILAAGVVQRGFALLSRGVVGATTEFVDYDQAIVSASAKFKDLNLATDEGRRKLAALKKVARETGKVTQFSASQSAAGLDFLAMAGFTSEQAMASLAGVVDLATVANVDLARSTDIASDSLGAFGLMTSDANQLQKNFTRLNDVMAATMSSTNTSMEDLFETIKKGAPQFTASGQSIETFNALAGIMANAGVKGSESGTALRNVMLRLAKPVGDAAGVIKNLNVKTKDQNNNFRDVIDILADFEKGLKGMGNQQRTAALATVFGARSVTGVNILLKEGTKNIRKFRKELIGSTGASKDMADIMRKSLGNQLKSLQSAALELSFKFIQAFEKKGAGAIQKLTMFLREVDIQPLINGIKSTIDIFAGLFSAIKSVIIITSPLIAAMVAYIATVKIMAALKAAQVFMALAKSQGIATAAQWALNVAMSANPLGLVIAGVTLLIAGLALLIFKWDVVKKAFINGAKAIWKVFKGVFGLIGSIFSVGGKMFSGLFGSDEKQKEKKDQERQERGEETQFIPPNMPEARSKQIDLKGLIEVSGLPSGSMASSKTSGAPDIPIMLLGAT